MNTKFITLIATLMILSNCGGGGSDSTVTDTSTNTQEEPSNNDDTSNGTTDTTDDANETQNDNDSPSASTPVDAVVDDGLLASNEPYYKYSWHIDSANSATNDTEDIINKDSDIGVVKAWEISKGNGIKVAVIDDGFDVAHEDLKANIAVVRNIDDDNNDVSNTNSDGTALHGNSCAGFIVSPINGKGSMGIAPQAKLIGIKLLSSDDSDTIRAFEYAQAQGAKVISCSWGTNDVSEAIVAKLKELYDAGITVLFASGNDGVSLDVAGTNDESEVEWVIGVGASGENNDVTSYSNYGKNLEVIAPGGDTETLGILGIDDMGSAGSSSQLDLVNNNYAFMDGTSFATPVASGVVTLMYAINPNITPAQVKTILTSTATKVGDTKASYVDNFDEKRAYGKINAYQAVLEAQKLQ